MRIFPKHINEILPISDINKFKTGIRKLSETETGEEIPSAIFIGTINSKGFKLRGKFKYRSSFRPDIKGKFIGTNQLSLKVNLNNLAVYIYLVIFFLINFSVFNTGMLWLYIPLVLITFMWYIMGIIAYTIEFKKLQPMIERIRELTR